MATKSNFEMLSFKLDGWKATAALIAIWWAPAAVAFVLGLLVGRGL